MSKYKCSVCDREINSDELKLTNDTKKCILHCIKNKKIKTEESLLLLSEISEKVKLRLLEILHKNYSYDFKYVEFPYMTEEDIFETLGKFKELSFDTCKFDFSLSFLENIKYFIKCEFFEFVGVNRRIDISKSYFNSCIFHKKVEFKKGQTISGNVFTFCTFLSNEEKVISAVKNIFVGSFYHNLKGVLPNTYFEYCTFEQFLDFGYWTKMEKIEGFKAIGCTFKDKVYFLNCKNINLLDFDDSTFVNKVKIQSCKINDANFYNTKFEDLADFYQTKFNTVNFVRTDFKGISVFSEVKFNCDVIFKYTKFLKHSIFRDTVISGKFNLRDSIFDAEANFLDITSKEREKDENNEYIGEPTDIKVANRETARIIKNFYDNSNNIIEANRFYKLEMKEKSKELKWNENLFEWLKFKFHGVSSNHSQNWILPLMWMIILCLPSTVTLADVNFTELILYNIFVKDIFDQIANLINPFSIMTKGESLTFGMLLFKVTIAYLIYQFIVSIRQNTRRK